MATPTVRRIAARIDHNTESFSATASPLPSSPETALEEAIWDATLPRLRAVLLQMVKDSVEASDLASKALLVASTSTSPPARTPMRDLSVNSLLNDTNDSDVTLHCINNGTLIQAGHSTPGRAGGNRKRKAYEVCCNCQQEYHVAENGAAVCAYHPGRKEINDDSSIWDDWEDDHYGPASEADDPECQEGFLWTCCGRNGGQEACTRASHQPAKSQRRRS